MWDSIGISGAAERLRQAASDPLLSPGAKARATELADRLAHGVRIVVAGPSGVGKSTLCDAIRGARQTSRPQTCSRFFTNEPLDAVQVALPGRVDMHPLGDCGLGHAQLIDMALPQGPADFATSVAESLAIADIVLWCTQQFDAVEADLWQNIPDPLKDHSFLVLTKADALAEQGVLQDRITALQPVVSEEFHSFFPVTTEHLRGLQTAGTAVPEGQWAASGLKALVDAVAALVTSGQRADLDSGLLFLERHGLTLDGPADALGPVTAKSEPAPQPQTAAQPSRLVFAAARDKIMERAYDLAELGFDEADGDMTGVLELCGTISEDLVAEMREPAAECPDVLPWCEAFEEASDKIMLMTMENDLRSAADAVTILLQLRRDLEHLSIP